MTTQHTPTPWNHYEDDTIRAKSFPVADTFFTDGRTEELAKANAAFIVRACNAHDELVAALQAVVAEGSEGWNEADGADLLTMCRAALAKVSK